MNLYKQDTSTENNHDVMYSQCLRLQHSILHHFRVICLQYQNYSLCE